MLPKGCDYQGRHSDAAEAWPTGPGSYRPLLGLVLACALLNVGLVLSVLGY